MKCRLLLLLLLFFVVFARGRTTAHSRGASRFSVEEGLIHSIAVDAVLDPRIKKVLVLLQKKPTSP